MVHTYHLKSSNVFLCEVLQITWTWELILRMVEAHFTELLFQRTNVYYLMLSQTLMMNYFLRCWTQLIPLIVHNISSIILDLQPCPISAGSERPRASPHYENYKLGKHQTNVTNAQQQYLLWLILRHHQRPRLVCDTNLVTPRDSHLSGDDQCLG